MQRLERVQQPSPRAGRWCESHVSAGAGLLASRPDTRVSVDPKAVQKCCDGLCFDEHAIHGENWFQVLSVYSLLGIFQIVFHQALSQCRLLLPPATAASSSVCCLINLATAKGRSAWCPTAIEKIFRGYDVEQTAVGCLIHGGCKDVNTALNNAISCLCVTPDTRQSFAWYVLCSP